MSAGSGSTALIRATAYIAHCWATLSPPCREEMLRVIASVEAACRAAGFDTIVASRVWGPRERRSNDARALWSDLRTAIGTKSHIIIVIYAGRSEGVTSEVRHAMEFLVPTVFLVRQGTKIGETLRPQAADSLAELSYRTPAEAGRKLSQLLLKHTEDIQRLAFRNHVTRQSERKSLLIGENIRRVRELRGWSRRQLAKEVGLKFREVQIAAIEDDIVAANPPLHHLIVIAQALGVSVTMLSQPPEEWTDQYVRSEVVAAAKEWDWSVVLLDEFRNSRWYRMRLDGDRPARDEIRAEMQHWQWNRTFRGDAR